jgi:hypothetical protein
MVNPAAGLRGCWELGIEVNSILVLQLYFLNYGEICKDAGLKAAYSDLIFRGLKPPAPSAKRYLQL